MSIWQAASGALNAAQLAAFGISMAYAKPGGVPIAFTAERRTRDPLESETMASFERIWTRRSNLPFEPTRGDTVLIGTSRYVVHDWKPDEDPDSDGLKIYLNKC